ncbi:UNVERIFIED_CONTAM: hypothetical protein RMT77_012976 [Armadillidium vulgare]
MVFKTWFLFLFWICLSLHTSSSLPEGCNLKVEIDYPEHLGVEPTVLCSSDCEEVGKTFYYRDEILEQEYNSIVRASFDQEGNVICEIMSKDILKREALTNSTSEGEVGTTASDAEKFDESTLDEFQSENSEVEDQYQSSVGEDQNQSSVGEDQNQSSVGEDQNQSSDGVDQYQSSEEDQDQYSEEEQVQSSEVEDQYQSSVGEDQYQSSVGEDQSQSSVGEDQYQSSVGEDQNQSSDGVDQYQSSVSEDQNQSSDGEDQYNSSEEDQDQPSVGEDQYQSSVGEDQDKSSDEDQDQSSVGEDQYQSPVGEDQYQSSEVEDQVQSSEEDQDQSSEEDQVQSSEVQTTLSNPEYTTDNSEVENQFNTSLKDDETKVNSESIFAPQEETEINKSGSGSESEEVLQEEPQESTENIETPEETDNSSNTTEKEIEGGTQKSETESSTFVEESQNEQQVTQINETESSTFVEELQNDQQVTDKNFETTLQDEVINTRPEFMETTNQTAFPGCSKGWTLNPNSKTCYLVTKNVMNWYDANIVCLQLGGKLSIFHSPKEINFVKENLELPESSWIGLKYTLSDNLTFKTWRWIDRSIADFTDWATGEPSSETSLWDSFWAYENCVEMKKSDGFAWNDERCTNRKRGLCSKKADLRNSNTCPEGWLMQNNKCYHFCAKDVTEEVANLHCTSYAVGVKLFVPVDQMEIVFVSDKLKEKNIISIWLGIKDTEESGDFRTPEGKLQTFFNWDFGEPSQSFWWFNTKECVEMSQESKMRRAKCSQELPFVCVLDL